MRGELTDLAEKNEVTTQGQHAVRHFITPQNARDWEMPDARRGKGQVPGGEEQEAQHRHRFKSPYSEAQGLFPALRSQMSGFPKRLPKRTRRCLSGEMEWAGLT